MKQYNSVKVKYPDAILLFRVGDFYETFGEDAVHASRILGIVLTKRKNGAAAFVDLAGFPHHSLDSYLPKLVKAGYRVAICDQLEDPKLAKGIVKRGITELVTPGVSYNEKTIDLKDHHFLAAIAQQKEVWGIAFLDLSTGTFEVGQGSLPYVQKLLHAYQPKEVLFRKHRDQEFHQNFGFSFHVFRMDDWAFTEDFGRDQLHQHFGTINLKGFGIDDSGVAIAAAGAIFQYLKDTQHDKLGHVVKVKKVEETEWVGMDVFTVRNLELLSSSNERGTSLVDILDVTQNPMGARMLRRWVMMPLRNPEVIQLRLDAVEHCINHSSVLEAIRADLKELGDWERIAARMAVQRITPRELVQLNHALTIVANWTKHGDVVVKVNESLKDLNELQQLLLAKIHEDAPHSIGKGWTIAQGVSEELDELRALQTNGKEKLKEIEERETERTGISSLKVSYNNVFGYYLEVRNTHKDKVPADWIRKQTLTQAERYITEELKEYESKILGAEEKILSIEQRLFSEIVQECLHFLVDLQYNSKVLAELDVLTTFACLAVSNGYTKPIIENSSALEIQDGRHPVIEKLLPTGEQYIANDVMLDPDNCQMMMITGPNMSGKSALLRQTAIIT